MPEIRPARLGLGRLGPRTRPIRISAAVVDDHVALCGKRNVVPAAKAPPNRDEVGFIVAGENLRCGSVEAIFVGVLFEKMSSGRPLLAGLSHFWEPLRFGVRIGRGPRLDSFNQGALPSVKTSS